jgi:hypothetical protein
VPHNPELVPRSPVRAHGFSTQDAFDWLDPHRGMGSGEWIEIVKNPVHPLGHPCRSPRPPACHGDGAPARAHLTRATVTRLAPSSRTQLRQDASYQSLQPTCCQRAPLKPTNSRARGSHLADPLFRDWPSPSTLVLGLDTVPSEEAPDSPRASPIPSDTAIWRRCISRHAGGSHLLRGHPRFFEGCQL